MDCLLASENCTAGILTTFKFELLEEWLGIDELSFSVPHPKVRPAYLVLATLR